MLYTINNIGAGGHNAFCAHPIGEGFELDFFSPPFPCVAVAENNSVRIAGFGDIFAGVVVSMNSDLTLAYVECRGMLRLPCTTQPMGLPYVGQRVQCIANGKVQRATISDATGFGIVWAVDVEKGWCDVYV